MRLSVSRGGGSVSELHFRKGPIYIGRQLGCQLFLPDRIVSRQHAVIYTTNDGKWVLEDLGSANKTFLNENAIHKGEIKDGDVIRISDFSITFYLHELEETEQQQEQRIHLDDTLVTEKPSFHIEVRRVDSKGAPQIRIPAKRVKDFSIATSQICKAADIKAMHRGLLNILLDQFASLKVWVALRRDNFGPMECQGGRRLTTESVKLTELAAQQHIADAIAKCEYVLVPQLGKHIAHGEIRSAIIAPILRGKDCYGVLYAANSMRHEHYIMADLDYLILLAVHTAAVLENL